METIRKILVPVDFSEHAGAALATAIGLARRFGAEIHLLHCTPLNPGSVSPYGIAVPETFAHDLRQAALHELGKWRGKVSAEGLTVREHLSTRFPPEVIPTLAEEIGADLIVIGTRGLSGLKHVLLGSVAERVLRQAPCPVWVVH